jgi:peptidoglycan/LPS O-acetylase OafA/YrhL
MPNTDLGSSSAAQFGRANNFDLIRLLLAVLVILSHSYIMFDGKDSSDPLAAIFHGVTLGEFAVDGFFLLSGYLIVQSWEKGPNLRYFIMKRVLRIYPGFIVAGLLSALVVGPLGAQAASYFSELEVFKLAKSMLLLKVPAVPPSFESLPYPTVNGSMWTIFFEFVCYLAVAVLGLAGAIRVRRYWMVATLALVLLDMAQHALHFLPSQNFYFPALRLSTFFFIGGCFYLFRERIPFHLLQPMPMLACVLLLLAGISFKELPNFVLAVGAGYLLFCVAFWQQPMLGWYRRFPDMSYGVYLYGWPVQKLLLWYVPGMTPRTLFASALACSLSLGLVSWYAIERPFLRLKSINWRFFKFGVSY